MRAHKVVWRAHGIVPTTTISLLGLLDLLQLRGNNGTARLLRDHELEAVKVGHGRALLPLHLLLSPRRVLPLGRQALGLDSLLQSTRASRARHLDHKVGQVQATERVGLACHTRRRAIDEGLSTFVVEASIT